MRGCHSLSTALFLALTSVLRCEQNPVTNSGPLQSAGPNLYGPSGPEPCPIQSAASTTSDA